MCLISAFRLGTSTAQAVAAEDMIVQCPSGVSESVCQSNPTGMQQHIEEGAVTSGRGQGKISGKRIMYVEVARYKNSIQVYSTVLLFSFSQLYENMKSNKDPPVITSTCTKSFMVSLVCEGLMSSNFMYTALFCCILLFYSQSFESGHIIITVSL